MATFRERFRRKNRCDREGRKREAGGAGGRRAGGRSGSRLIGHFPLAFSIFHFLYDGLVLRATRQERISMENGK